MTRILLNTFTVLFFALASISLSASNNIAHAAKGISEEGAKSFVESISNDGLSFLANNNLTMPQKKKRFKKLLDNNFDIKTIAQFALGIHWRNITDEEKKEYLDLFEKMVVNVYARRFNEYQGQKFEIKKARKGGKRDYIVYSQILPPEGQSGAKVNVDWRLRNKDGKFKVIDIAVEGISMIMTQRDDFAAVIQKGKGDINFLLAELRSNN